MRRLVTIDLTSADLGLFDAYENTVLPLVARHGGRVELRVRAVDASSETHLLHFPDRSAYEAYLADPARQAAQSLWRGCGATTRAVEVEPVAAARAETC